MCGYGWMPPCSNEEREREAKEREGNNRMREATWVGGLVQYGMTTNRKQGKSNTNCVANCRACISVLVECNRPLLLDKNIKKRQGKSKARQKEGDRRLGQGWVTMGWEISVSVFVFVFVWLRLYGIVSYRIVQVNPEKTWKRVFRLPRTVGSEGCGLEGWRVTKIGNEVR